MTTRWLWLCCLVLGCQSPGPAPTSAEVTGPRLPDVSVIDRDADKLDDRLVTGGSDVIAVHVVLTRSATPAQLEAFAAAGGTIRYVFKAISHGFLGKIPRNRVADLPAVFEGSLHVVSFPPTASLLGDVETRIGRARAAWPTTTGSPNTTIAIFDSGLDVTHPDLAGRKVFWKDYSTDAYPNPVDRSGHGTHVAGIALGSGAAFAGGPTDALRFTTAGVSSTVSQRFLYGVSMFAPGPLTLSSTARVSSTQSAELKVVGRTLSTTWQPLNSTTGVPPLSLTGQAVPGNSLFQVSLEPSVWPAGEFFAVTQALTGYPRIDAFPVMSGVAPGTRWYAGKIFTDDGAGEDGCPLIAFDDLLLQHQALKVKVVNLSLSSASPQMAAAVATMVDNGLVVVMSAGNAGPSGTTLTMGLTARGITVGAVTAWNQLTGYTSVGSDAPTAEQDLKPDLVAPGGSPTSPVLSTDPNGTDALTYPDAQPDDYFGIQGTSMAAPFVSGAAALVIDALEQNGLVWDYTSPGGPLRVKTLLLATASETNTEREVSTNSPTLGRAAAPKDRFEGYGMINPDAAVEAVSQLFASPLSSTVAVSVQPQSEKRVWARKFPIHAGASAQFTLAAPATGDFDLYVYAEAGDAKGNPVILASSTNAAAGAPETVSFTSALSQTALVVVKRVSGTGTFQLTGTVGNSPPQAPSTVFLTSASLSSDTGNPSASVWGENVTFTSVAVGTAAAGIPTGVIEFKTTGMLARGAPATGGTIGSAVLVANGPGCQTATLPCASATFTTPNLVVSSVHANNHRLFSSYGGDANYAPEPVTNLNGMNAKNHTVNPRAITDVDFLLQPSAPFTITNATIPLVVTLLVDCPAGRTCIRPPPPISGGVDGIDGWGGGFMQRRCDNPYSPSTSARLLDSNWQVKCDLTMTDLYLSTHGASVSFVASDPYFIEAPGSPLYNHPTAIGYWEPVQLYGVANPTAYGVPFSVYLFSPRVAGTVDVVDGPCNSSPPPPVLGTFTFAPPTDTRRTLTLNNLPSGVHEFHLCNVGGFPSRSREAGVFISSPTTNSLTHTVLGSVAPVATATTVSVTPRPGTYGVDALVSGQITSAGNPVTDGRVALIVDGALKRSAVPDASGQVSVAVPLLAVGAHTVLAIYTPSVALVSSNATLAGGYLVNKAVPELGLAVLPGGVVPLGRNVKLRALAGRAPGANSLASLPGGTVTFREGATVLCQSAPLAPMEAANAVAECDVPAPAVGTHAITVDYAPGGDPNYEPATLNSSFIVGVLASTVTFSAAPPSGGFGQDVTWAVNVTATNGNTLSIPSGTVTFTSGTTTLCAAVPLAGGNASCTAFHLVAGTQNIVATYSGDGSFPGSSATAVHQVAKGSVTTQVISSGTPSRAGRTVLFEARVLAPAGTPGGLVDFIFDQGTTTLTGSTGVAIDSQGRAVFSTSALTAGSHTVRAHSQTSANFDPSLEAAEVIFTQNVLAPSAGLTVMKVPAGSSSFGEEVLLQAFVESGEVTFAVDGAAPVVVRADSTGRAVWALSALSVGSHAIVVSDGTTSITVTHVVTRAVSTTVLTSSQEPQRVGGAVAFTATVTPAGSGTVVFKSDGVALGAPVAVTSGVATFTTSALPLGVHALRAEYSGDTSVFASAGTFTQTITADATRLVVTVSPQPATYGQTTTIRVVATDAIGVPVLGEVEVHVNGVDLGPLTLNVDGTLSIPLGVLPGGQHTATVTFTGIGSAPASSSVSIAIERAATTATLSVSATAPVTGQLVTLTAHVASGAAVQGGTVTFFDGTTVVGIVTVNASGDAVLSALPLPLGTHSLRAEYSGAASYLPSVTATLPVTVNQAPTVTTVVVPSSPIMPGTAFALSATVVVPTPGQGTPTGTVTFSDGATALGTAALANDGTAGLAGVTLPSGLRELTAQYSGDTQFLSSTSAVREVDLRIGATLSVVATPNPALYLEPVTFTATLSEATATGSVEFLHSMMSLGTSTLDGGAAAFSWTANLAPGPQTIDAKYGGDVSHGLAQASVALSIQERPTTIELTQSSSTSVEGDAVTFTAAVTLGVTPPTPPALTVTFFEGASELASGVSATGGTASFSTSTLAKGNHTLTARFDGVSGFAPSMSGVVTHEVLEAGSDAGIPDAGTDEPDAGVPEEVDAGIPGTPGTPSGCNCGSAGDPLAVLLLALSVSRRRKSQRVATT